jgi:hypothetical protein
MLEPHLAERKHQEDQGFNILNPQPVQSFSTPWYTEKTGHQLQCKLGANSTIERFEKCAA